MKHCKLKLSKQTTLTRKEVEEMILDIIRRQFGDKKVTLDEHTEDAPEQVTPEAPIAPPVCGWAKYENEVVSKGQRISELSKIVETGKVYDNGFELYSNKHSGKGKTTSKYKPLFLGISLGSTGYVHCYIPVGVMEALGYKKGGADLYYNKTTNEIGIKLNKEGEYYTSSKGGVNSGVVISLFSFCRDNGIKINKSFRSPARIDGDMIIASMVEPSTDGVDNA